MQEHCIKIAAGQRERAGIRQSVKRLGMGWRVRGSNLGGGQNFTQLSSPPTSYTKGTGSLFLGAKRPGRGVTHPPHLAPRLKKE